MQQLWQTICLAYQGDRKPCDTPCLHCARIEEALAADPLYNARFPECRACGEPFMHVQNSGDKWLCDKCRPQQ